VGNLEYEVADRPNVPSTAPSVVMRAVRKRFGEVVALHDAELTLYPGEVHALLGENGAGKTTLMGVLAGMLQADSGSILVQGEPTAPRSPREAWAAGVGMVHQHFKLVGRLTVMENLALGFRLAAKGLRLPYPEIRARVAEVASQTGLEVPLEALVEGLPVGVQQRVEILKLLIRDPDVVILDEPTAVLAPGEVDRLHALLRTFAERGKTVVLIAHKLDEVLRVSDRLTVLRQGRSVMQTSRSEVNEGMLVRAMVGTDVVPARRESPADRGGEVARLTNVHVPGPRGEELLRGVNLSVDRGEIVAVAGVDGNGQRELAAVLAGRMGVSDGVVDRPEGVGFIPEDRGGEALVGEFTLAENMALAGTDRAEFRRGPWIRWDRVRERTSDLIQKFDVRATGAHARADELSGGNQQKLVVARELERASDLLVAQNPARGLDVLAEEFVHTELLRLRLEGPDGGPPPGIVLISTDLDEVMALADRVLVLIRGQLVDVGATADREEVGRVMVRGPAP
jgi:general nucleoside transport system ATP-binding protein